MKVRIKVGARVYQDRCFGQWPACLPPRGHGAVDQKMEFDAEQRPAGGWVCRADGFGRRTWKGERGGYGNGAITVLDDDGVEALKAHNAAGKAPAR